MGRNLPIELVTEHNHVLKFTGQDGLLRTAVVPDPGFAQEVKTRALHQLRLATHRVRAEEDRRAEDALKRRDQAAVLCASFLHSESMEHLGPAVKAYGGTLLLHSQRGQIDRHEPVLAKRQTVGGMSGDL